MKFFMMIAAFFIIFTIASSKNPRIDKLMMRTFGIGPQSLMNLPVYKNIGRHYKNKIANEILLRDQEELKRRKIVNDYLMPLTRGNSFMMDFYSGRY